ncbi:UvrD-family helicase [Catovirus CTV1]|uniref:UvrD-family helicase n=1 Tax=Catovirus CTV1 TaxID=1977631 RepID=A0A1V0SAZ4_9VIRU|nr:UvrD-family helicase [Catovirus CTV1]
MDIGYYFSNEVKTRAKHSSTKFRQLISDLASKKVISLLEYTYLFNFLKEGGTIVNVNWFIEIAKKANMEDFNEESIKLFENLLTNQDKRLIFNNSHLIKDLVEKNVFEFSGDQKRAITDILNFFVDFNQKTFGLYGYAGTGKTTTIVELTSYLIKKGLIKSIAYTAPTNKAVNIIKAKFRQHLKEIAEEKTGTKYDNNYNMEDLLEVLYKKGIKIEFITIHRLLNYKNDFDSEGERIFLQKGETNIKEYQVVIIDECSMLPFKIIKHLFEDVRTTNRNNGDNFNKSPKLLFTGDRAQLNAVNELNNVLFNYDNNMVKKMLHSDTNKTKSQYVSTSNEIEITTNSLGNDIKNMKYVIMKEVMRSKIDNIVNLCINVRQWLEKEIKNPEPRKFVGEGVSIYKHDPKIKKTDGKWFKTFLNNFENNEGSLQTSNIILTWTNRQCEEYNNCVRKIVFKNKEKIDKFEKGDILMLNDFYNIDESKSDKDKDDKKRFYTSEQIKVMEIEKTQKKCADFTLNLSKSANKIKGINHIEEKFKNTVKLLNSKTKRNYQVWKLYVNRLTDIYDKTTETQLITVIHDSCDRLLNDEKINAAGIIKKFRDTILAEYKEQQKTIEKVIIRQLWRDWSKIFIEPFAKVNYGCSITTHKSQSSTYVNAFIDVNDILLNNSNEEAKRCLYTALTRASKQVHLLI